MFHSLSIIFRFSPSRFSPSSTPAPLSPPHGKIKALPLRERGACRPPRGRQAGGTSKVWRGAAVTEGVQNDSKRAERCFVRLLFGLTLFDSELRLHLVGHLRADLVGFKYIALVERFRPHRRAAGAARGQLLKFVLLQIAVGEIARQR